VPLFFPIWATIPPRGRKANREAENALKLQINVNDLALWDLLTTFAISTNVRTAVRWSSLNY